MVDKIQSAWWIIYRMSDDNTPEYLLIKRHALSNKVERIAPKWKIHPGETEEQAALRETCEETGLKKSSLKIRDKIDTLSLQLFNDDGKLGIDKDIAYFLMQYTGDPKAVTISNSEWFLWSYKWATMREVLALVIYKDLRQIFADAHSQMQSLSVKDKFLKDL